MSNKTKSIVTALTAISAIGLGFTGSKEGFRSAPYKDVAGVPTVAYGNTVHPDGRKVKMTDKPVSKKQGVEYLKAHYAKEAPVFNKSLQGVKLSQDEYDLYADFSYQFGQSAWKSSAMLKNLKQGKYIQACKSLEAWRFSRVGVDRKKVDCRVNRGCAGVWNRQHERIQKCLGANT